MQRKPKPKCKNKGCGKIIFNRKANAKYCIDCAKKVKKEQMKIVAKK